MIAHKISHHGALAQPGSALRSQRRGRGSESRKLHGGDRLRLMSSQQGKRAEGRRLVKKPQDTQVPTLFCLLTLTRWPRS